MAAFSSAGQVRRRPAPVNTSMRRARSGIGVSSEIDMGRSSKSAPNFTPHAWLRKALPRRRLPFSAADAFAVYLAPLRRTKWFVYAKRPFAGPAAVLAYLSRYTHRVAL